MKQSLIITVVICLFLGESFSLITKRANQKENKANYCCNKVCNDKNGEKQVKNTMQAEPYLPMVNMLRYTL